jgi:hypothetical protein
MDGVHQFDGYLLQIYQLPLLAVIVGVFSYVSVDSAHHVYYAYRQALAVDESIRT